MTTLFGGAARISSAIGIAIALLAPLPAAAKDASVERRLDEVGLTYKVDDDGDYRITYNYKKEGRSQLVFVSGDTESVAGALVREVFSPAAVLSKDDVSGRALDLLKDSGGKKVGAWEVRGGVLYFVIKVPEPVSGPQLEKFMDLAASIADNKEIEVSGSRDGL